MGCGDGNGEDGDGVRGWQQGTRTARGRTARGRTAMGYEDGDEDGDEGGDGDGDGDGDGEDMEGV